MHHFYDTSMMHFFVVILKLASLHSTPWIQKYSQDILVNLSFCVPHESHMDLEQHEE